jgi:hypothetical protein
VSWRVAIDDALATTTRRAVYAQQYRVTTHGPLALAQDQWHRVTLLLGRETRVGGGDGVVQVWVDGALVIDRTSAATGTAPIAGVRYPTTMRAGPSRAQSRWVDDVVVATP